MILAYPVVAFVMLAIIVPDPRANTGRLVFLVLLLLGFVPGCVTAWLASAKGRQGCGWFVGGFFFNWLAMLIILWLPAVTAQRAYEGPVETCPRCQGRGYVMNQAERIRTGRTDTAVERCPVCGGEGEVPAS